MITNTRTCGFLSMAFGNDLTHGGANWDMARLPGLGRQAIDTSAFSLLTLEQNCRTHPVS